MVMSVLNAHDSQKTGIGEQLKKNKGCLSESLLFYFWSVWKLEAAHQVEGGEMLFMVDWSDLTVQLKRFSLVLFMVGSKISKHFTTTLGKMYLICSFVPVFWIHHASQKWQKQCFKCMYYASCANMFTWSFHQLHSLIRNSFCHPFICSTRLHSITQSRSLGW